MKEPINVMVSCDDNGLYLQKLSLLNLMMSSPDDDVHVYFLNLSLAAEKINELSDLISAHSSFDFTEIKVDSAYKKFILEQMALWNCNSYISCVPECFIRLCLPFIFPEMKKCIWLDNDVFILKPVSSIYNTAFNSSEYFGAFVEPFFVNRSQNKIYNIILAAYGINNMNYFCCGVMVFNMDSYRRHLSMTRFKEIDLKLGKYFYFKEQDLLNISSLGHVKFLDDSVYVQYYQDEWLTHSTAFDDYLAQKNLDDTVLIHSCGYIKPCNSMYNAREITERVYTPYINIIGRYKDPPHRKAT